ncbi:MAG TPA: hypothetical protein VHC19_26985 [Pirellulales bacterium]|nr:hypothetical protein [Pirellulales bacterium]
MESEPSRLPPQIPETAEAPPLILERATQRYSAAARQSAPPRMSVVHLLLCVAWSGVFMAAVRKLSVSEPGGWGLMLAAAGAIGYGAAWTGLCIWLARVLRGAVWPIEPGLWLLVAWAVRLGLDTAIRLWLSQTFRSAETVLDAVTVGCLTLPLLNRSLSFAWQVCFALLLSFYAWPLVASIADRWFFMPGWIWSAIAWSAPRQAILVAAFVGLFAAIDLPESRRRSWLHWTGLGVCAWMALVSLLTR